MPRSNQNSPIQVSLTVCRQHLPAALIVLVLFEQFIQAYDRADGFVRREWIKLIEMLSLPHQPPIDEEYRQRHDFDAGAQTDVFEAELLDVIDETSTTRFAA